MKASIGHAPRWGFNDIDNGHLVVAGATLSQYATLAGRTPFYLYDHSLMTRRVNELRHSLPQSIRLHYAMKANPMPAVVHHLAGMVDGIDVASAGEMVGALDALMPASKISFAGPGKSDAELRQAIAAGITINLESAREMETVAAIGHSMDILPSIAVRVNPDFELKRSGMQMSGGPKPFGIDAELVPEILVRMRSLPLDFRGFHIYSGSQNLQAESLVEAYRQIVELAARLAPAAPGPVRTLNIGGGFGIPYFPGDCPLDIGAVAAGLRALVLAAKKSMPLAELILELGRFLVGEAGLYVCRVIDRKVSRGEVFLIVDGGLHHHLAASGNFGQVLRKNYPIAIGNRMTETPSEHASVVGCLCTPLDRLGDKVHLPPAKVGDLMVVFQSGAYGLTASPTAFLSHPRPVELLV